MIGALTVGSRLKGRDAVNVFTRWTALFLLAAGVVCTQVQGEPAGGKGQPSESAGASIENQKKHSLSWKRTPKLTSRWVEELSLRTPFPEYPRPQLVRKDWLNLNGEWDFLGDGPQPPELPKAFSEKALVPSATQAVTSCLEKEWHRGWYRKTVEIPSAWGGKKVLLHFEAVGGISTVYFNSQELGKNSGSFKRFSFELTDIKAGRANEILIHFDDTDPRIPRGKPDHVSGIWQTVWLEPVPANYIRSFKQTPDIDAGQLQIEVDASGSADGLTLVATAKEGGKKVASVKGRSGEGLMPGYSESKTMESGKTIPL